MNYDVVKRANPLDRTKELYYPAPVWGAEVSEDELSEEISYASSVNQADVKAVISSFIEMIPRHLMKGETLRLGNLGIFRMSFESAGQEEQEKVSASDIKKSKILFRPSMVLKKKIEKTSYTKVRSRS